MTRTDRPEGQEHFAPDETFFFSHNSLSSDGISATPTSVEIEYPGQSIGHSSVSSIHPLLDSTAPAVVDQYEGMTDQEGLPIAGPADPSSLDEVSPDPFPLSTLVSSLNPSVTPSLDHASDPEHANEVAGIDSLWNSSESPGYTSTVDEKDGGKDGTYSAAAAANDSSDFEGKMSSPLFHVGPVNVTPIILAVTGGVVALLAVGLSAWVWRRHHVKREVSRAFGSGF